MHQMPLTHQQPKCSQLFCNIFKFAMLIAPNSLPTLILITRRAGFSSCRREVTQSTIYQVRAAGQCPVVQARCVTLPFNNRCLFLIIVSRPTIHRKMCLTEDVVGCCATSSKLAAALAAPNSLRTLHLVPLHGITQPITQTR